jgi:hypothetical protein
LEAAFILLEFPSPSRRIFIGSYSLPPLSFAVSVLHPRRGIYVMFVGLTIRRPHLRRTLCPPDASHAIPPRVLRFEASRHVRIPSPSCWAYGLGFEAQTRKPSSNGFVGIPPNPACSARPPTKPLDSTATVHRLDRPRLRLSCLATMWPAPSPAVHRVPRTEPTCLSISRRPLKAEDLSCPFFTCNNTN